MKHCSGASLATETPTAASSPGVALWLIPEELDLPNPGSSHVGDEPTSYSVGFTALVWQPQSGGRHNDFIPRLEFGSLRPC